MDFCTAVLAGNHRSTMASCSVEQSSSPQPGLTPKLAPHPGNWPQTHAQKAYGLKTYAQQTCSLKVKRSKPAAPTLPLSACAMLPPQEKCFKRRLPTRSLLKGVLSKECADKLLEVRGHVFVTYMRCWSMQFDRLVVLFRWWRSLTAPRANVSYGTPGQCVFLHLD